MVNYNIYGMTVDPHSVITYCILSLIFFVLQKKGKKEEKNVINVLNVNVSKYPPNATFRNANINVQHANVTGSILAHYTTTAAYVEHAFAAFILLLNELAEYTTAAAYVELAFARPMLAY